MKRYSILIATLIFISLLIIWAWFQINTKEPIYIALVTTLSGAGKSGGLAIRNGTEMAIEEVNSTGGISGQLLKLMVFDDQGNPNIAKEKANQIAKDNKYLMVLGHYFSSTSLAAGEIYKQAQIPVITGTATADDITQDNKWYFRVVPNNGFEGMFLANYIIKAMKQTKVTIIHDDKDDYSIFFGKRV